MPSKIFARSRNNSAAIGRLGAVGARPVRSQFMQVNAINTLRSMLDSASGMMLLLDEVVDSPVKNALYSGGLGSELLVDGDMEAAGTAAWTALFGATLSKQATNPHGGTQVLRIARNVLNSPAATQGILTIGNTYRATGWAKSDGNAVPRVFMGSLAAANLVFTGTTSTDWQPFDVEHIPTLGSTFFIQSVTSTGTEYTEWDDVSVRQIGELDGDNAGCTINQPGIDNRAYLWDGATNYIKVANNAKLANNTTQRWAFLVNAASAGEGNTGAFCVWGDGGTTPDGMQIRFNGGGLPFLVVVYNTVGGGFSTSSTTVLTVNKWAWVFVDYDDAGTRKPRIFIGQDGAVNEVVYGANAALTGTFFAPITDLFLGNRSTNNFTFDGLMDIIGTDGGLWTQLEMERLTRIIGWPPRRRGFDLGFDSGFG